MRSISCAVLATLATCAMLTVSGCGASPPQADPSAATSAAAESAGARVRALRAAKARAAAERPEVIPADAAVVMAAARAPGAHATIVNVWATWCGPCREEFPEIVKLERDYRAQGLRVVFVSADFDDQMPAVKRFLIENAVTERSYIKHGDEMAFINGIEPRWSGALPATLVLDADGHVTAFWEGRASYKRFESEVKKILTPHPPAS